VSEISQLVIRQLAIHSGHGAHPDDIEFYMVGRSCCSNARLGNHYMNIGNGCCGSVQYNAKKTPHHTSRPKRNALRKFSERTSTRASAATSKSFTT